MPTIRRFVVVPAVPDKLKPLTELAYNLWCLSELRSATLFQRLDADLWESTNHNPVRLLSLIGQEKLQAAAADEGFLAHLNRILADLKHYMEVPTWHTQNYPDSKARIAYFSAELASMNASPSTPAASASSPETILSPPPTWGYRWSRSASSIALATSAKP